MIKLTFYQLISISNPDRNSVSSVTLYLVKRNISHKLMLHIFANMILYMYIVPTIQRTSNHFILKDNPYYGLFMIMIILMIGLLSQEHHYYFITPLRTEFKTKIKRDFEDYVNSIIYGSHFDKIKEVISTNFERTKMNAQDSMYFLIDSCLTNVMSLFPFFGYIGFIMTISIKISVLYVLGMIMIVMYCPKEKKTERGEYQNAWQMYDGLKTGLYTDLIHFNEKETLNEMSELLGTIEKSKENDKKINDKYMNKIVGLYTIVLILGIVELMRYLPPIETIILFVMYMSHMKSAIHSISYMYSQYSDTVITYDKILKIMNECPPREKVNQIKDFNAIRLNELTYHYPKSKDFKLTLGNQMIFKRGDIILLKGNSGNGKTTFLNILNGIIPYCKYTSDLFIDDNKIEHGFCTLIESRNYIEQCETIDYKSSIYEIITRQKLFKSYQGSCRDISNISLDIPNISIVYDALIMAGCDNFVSLSENPESSKKWIYMDDPGFSGGEKGRIALARGLYRLMINVNNDAYKIACFDEFDKSIEASLLIEISTNIYKYCKDHHILTFIVAHSSEVQKMNYDQIILFDKGLVKSL